MFELLYPSSPAPVFPRPSVRRPGLNRHTSEMLPIIEQDGLVIGQAQRRWCHSGSKPLHPVVHLYIIDRFGKFYLQKRSMDKDLYPGLWDMSVGGHVSYGEGIQEALFREAAEEIGLTRFNPVCIGTYIYEDDRQKEYVVIFAFVGHPELIPDEVEVQEGRWWDVREIDKAMGTGIFTPEFEEEFSQLRDRLLALL